VDPPGEAQPPSEADSDTLLTNALERLSVGQAASEVAKATGLPRRNLYARALALKGSD